MFRDFSLSAFTMGILASFVGFAGSFAVVIQGLIAIGASEAQAASALMALSVLMGITGIILSATSRIPVSVAWSTPGAALLATTGAVEGGFGVAVGAFLICGVGILVAGLWRSFGNAVGAIPSPLANAMLAGILLGLCLAPFKAIAFDPMLGLPMVIAWVVIGAWKRILAVPAALFAFVLVIGLGLDIPAEALRSVGQKIVPELQLVRPNFSLAGLINIALPLFVVTMASQNIPGIAVLRSNGYETFPRPWFSLTGLATVIAAPFGGHGINLAAITAAMCAGEDAHPDKVKRYWAAIVSGVGYIVFGLTAGAVTAFVSLAPSILIEAVAGLALIGALVGAVRGAFVDAEYQDAAAITFLLTASGVSILGISGAFWGLLGGGAVILTRRLFSRSTR